jgi:hypothetical protein
LLPSNTIFSAPWFSVAKDTAIVEPAINATIEIKIRRSLTFNQFCSLLFDLAEARSLILLKIPANQLIEDSFFFGLPGLKP